MKIICKNTHKINSFCKLFKLNINALIEYDIFTTAKKIEYVSIELGFSLN